MGLREKGKRQKAKDKRPKIKDQRPKIKSGNEVPLGGARGGFLKAQGMGLREKGKRQKTKDKRQKTKDNDNTYSSERSDRHLSDA
jgi:hypothetical protein